MATKKNSSTKSASSRGKSVVAKMGETMSDGAKVVARTTKKIVKRTGKALEPVAKTLGLSRKAKSTTRATAKRSTKKKSK